MTTIDSANHLNSLNSLISNSGVDRRTFIKGAGAAALAGAAAIGSGSADAAEPASHTTPPGGKYDFDTPYNRMGSNCARWCTPASRYPGGEFRYGLGVATMDFECAPCITEALSERVGHHSWGYMSTTDSLRDSIVQWVGQRHGQDIDPEIITLSDGIYPGMIAAMRAFIPAHSKVLLNTPVYTGFYSMARAAHVQTVDSPLVRRNGRYEIDWEDLEAKMTPDVRAMIVCNPQNPTGNVWTEDELLRIGRLCLEHNIVVLSDEIHCDFVRPGHRYVPFSSLPDEAVVNNSLTFNSISKTFNLAGMKNAYYYSRSPVLLARVNQFHRAELSTLGVVANEAAYNEGADWFDQANTYIDGNHSFMENYVRNNMPMVEYTRNEGTFMNFLDFSRVMEAVDAEGRAKAEGKDTAEEYFQDWLVHESGAYLNAGSSYGTGGAGNMRVNVASSRRMLREALESMATAIGKV
ncbi:MAG: MalY/PatB family protein [Pseudohongiellaceae bacterium]